MTWSERTAVAFGAALQGAAWVLMAVGGLGFFYADNFLRDFFGWGWVSAEIVGILGSLLCLVCGLLLRGGVAR